MALQNLFFHLLFADPLKFSLLLLFLPLSAFAQFGRGYTGPTMQQNQQSRDNFNRSANQRTQDWTQGLQSRQLQRDRPASGGQRGPRMPSEAELKARTKQQQAEREANENLARLAQEQQRKRQENPAKNPQQAEAQQKADDKQLNLLAVKSYHDVFLVGQVANALQARKLSPQAEQRLHNLTDNLTSDAWWSKQQGAQLTEKLTAYSDTLTSLTTGLLGFDLASPPPTPAQLPASRVDDLLATGTFDQNAAGQLIQEVALAEKLIAGKGLAGAVVQFKNLNGTGAPNQERQSTPKKLRKEVTASLHRVVEEMYDYSTRIASLSRLSSVQDVLLKSTSRYLAKSGK